MQKSDLRSGMKVTFRNGYKAIVMIYSQYQEYDLIMIGTGLYTKLDRFRDNLTDKNNDEDWDIVKVYTCDQDMSKLFTDFENIVWKRVWKRISWESIPKIKELTMDDIEKTFGCKCKIIK